MSYSNRRQYLLVGNRQKHRRYSAPENIRSGHYTSEESEQDSIRSKVSSSDFSIHFEGQSGSDSSLELDTTVASRDASPQPESVVLREGSYDCKSNHDELNIWCLICTWPVWRTVLIAQAMSLCVSIIDLTINGMKGTKNGLSVSAQSFPLYIILGLSWTPQLAMRGGGRGLVQVLRHSGLRYIFLSIFHVEGATMTISTLQYKSYIGNQTIDCVAVWLSFIVAYVCLEVEFQKTHAAGFGIAFLGAIGMALTNPEEKIDDDEAWGDIMRFGIGLFLSFNTMAQELIVKSIDTVEYLGMIGFLGSLICGIQTIVSSTDNNLPTDTLFWCSLIIFTATQFIFSCLKPRILREVGSTGMHLALITSPFYNQLLLEILENTSFQVKTTFPYLLIILGSYVFTLKRTTIGKHYFYPVKVTLDG